MRRRGWIPALLALGFGGVLAAAAALWILAWTVEPPRHALLEEQAIGGFDPHLLVSVRDVARREERDLVRWTVVVRARNSAVESDVRTGSLRCVVRDGAGTVHRPIGPDRFPDRLGRGERVDVAFAFELPTAVRGPMLWVYPDDVVTRVLPGGARNPLTPKLVLRLVEEGPEP